MPLCECEECTSVYSPASYFVELLQYLRNNNLGPDPASGNSDPKNNKNIKPGIENTPLEKLFRRRPDLGCLELTCDNTFTVLPYIDLVNEVMESFVVHLEEYEKSPKEPKQARLDTFNVEDETTSELLAQPQHTNYQAYCILKSAVYPFTLPYHQPIDATRIFLKYLGTSRYELLNTYRAVDEACANNSFTSEGQNELKKLHQQTLDRAVDAEFLGMTQEEYIILTKEAFWPKGYFDIALGKNHTKEEYQKEIGVKPVHEYYGYETKDAMLDIDETNQLGLTFVKKRFLPLTGIQYIDLVEILKTQFINPNHPQGDNLKILESIRFSYRFLQTLVDTNSNNPSIRFAKLVAFLETAQFFVPLLDAYLHPDPCQQQKPGWHLEIRDLRKWVYCYFERIGELIVLEAGEGPYLPIEGKVYTKLLQEASEPVFVGTLRKDGLIVDENEEFIGSITIDSQVIRVDGQLFISQFEEGTQLEVRDSESNPIGHINQSSILVSKDSETTVNWSPAQDTCDLDKVRLVHLDGTALSDHEYDRFQRFIRLWRKLGWTINEVDKALVGLSAQKDPREGATASDDCEYVGFEIFDDNCTSSSGGFLNGCNNNDSEDSCDDVEQWTNCVERNDSISEITPDFLNQIVAVRKLLDLSGLSLIQLLAFWSDISTVGEKSLYGRLFLTHNSLGIDKVFKADRSGAYLTKSAKISDHLPVLMAALRLKSDDIMNMMDEKFFTMPLTDLLSLANVSTIYRYSVLAKILHLRIEDLDGAIELFGEPFKSAQETLSFMEKWGKIEDAGLEFRQVNYIIKGVDDKLRLIAPNKRTILQLTKTLYDGLNGIDREHKDIFIPESPDEKKNLIAEEEKKIEATTELVRSKIGLLFEPVVVEKIIGLLDGTTVYTTKAPPGLDPKKIPENLKKLKYISPKDSTSAGIQVTGILTEDEKNAAKSLFSDKRWAKAIDRIGKQPQLIFDDAFLGIFPTEDRQKEARNKLLEVDEPVTAIEKRFYFIQNFLPFLRQKLAHRFIIDTISSVNNLPKDVTDELLSNLLHVEKVAAISILQNIKTQAIAVDGVWNGYLIPPIDGDYYFSVVSGDDTEKLQPLGASQVREQCN